MTILNLYININNNIFNLFKKCKILSKLKKKMNAIEFYFKSKILIEIIKCI